MSADDIATVLAAIGDSWPAAVALTAVAAAIIAWRALPQLAQIRASVDDVRHEFTNNSGSTIRDAVDRLEKAQSEQNRLLTEHISDDLAWKIQIEEHLTGGNTNGTE